MKLSLTSHEIRTLEKTKDGWRFEIKTKKGKLTVEGIPTEEEAVKKCEQHCLSILRSILKK